MSEHRGRLDEILNQRVPARPGQPYPEPLADGPRADPAPPAGRGAPQVPSPPPAGRPLPAGDPAAPPDTPRAAASGTPPSAADRLEQVAAGLRRAVAGLESSAAAASSRPYEAMSDDRTVAVTLDGRPRVSSVRIGERAIRSGPGPLAASVAVALNRALEAARRGGQEALLATAGPGLEPWVRGAIDTAAQIAGQPGRVGSGPAPGAAPGRPDVSLAELRLLRQSVPERQAAARAEAIAEMLTGTSRDGRITATVNGLGEVTGITVSALALRGSDHATLGNRVAEAVNAALDQADQDRRARRQAGGAPVPGDPRAAGEAVVEMLSHRMDALLGRLHAMSRSLDGISDDLALGLGRLMADLQDLAAETPADGTGD